MDAELQDILPAELLAEAREADVGHIKGASVKALREGWSAAHSD